jgi:hypothetical protein
MGVLDRLFGKKAEPDQTDLRRFLEKYPEALTEAGDKFLGEAIAKAQKEGDLERRVQLEMMRDLLRHVREKGIDATLREEQAEGGIYLSQYSTGFHSLQEFITAPTLADSRRILEKHPELLTDAIDTHLEELITKMQTEGNHQMRQVLELNRALLRRCREMGIEAAFREIDAGFGR